MRSQVCRESFSAGALGTYLTPDANVDQIKNNSKHRGKNANILFAHSLSAVHFDFLEFLDMNTKKFRMGWDCKSGVLEFENIDSAGIVCIVASMMFRIDINKWMRSRREVRASDSQ